MEQYPDREPLLQQAQKQFLQSIALIIPNLFKRHKKEPDAQTVFQNSIHDIRFPFTVEEKEKLMGAVINNIKSYSDYYKANPNELNQ
jgi:hypothetical protein